MKQLLRRAVTVVLAVTLVAAVGGTVVIAMFPLDTTEPFTEFYVLGPDGQASVPETVSVDGSTTLVATVENYEHETVSYTVVVEREGDRLLREEVTLADDERWQQRLDVTFEETGRREVNLYLYRGEPGEEPYRELSVTYTVEDG